MYPKLTLLHGVKWIREDVPIPGRDSEISTYNVYIRKRMCIQT